MLILFAYIVLCRVTAVSWISQGFWAMLLTKTVECPCAATIKYLKTPLYVQCSKHQTSKKSAAPSSPRTLVTEIWNSSIWFYMLVCYIGYCLAQPFIACHSNLAVGQLFILPLLPLTTACPPTPHWCICLPLCDLDCCVAAYIPGNLDSWKHKTIQCNKIEFQQAKAESDKAVRTSENEVKISTFQLKKAPNSQ